jgi:hypothetical protein
MKLSLIPLLVHSEGISAEAKQALTENRLEDAAAILIRENDLECDEAGELLDVQAC